MSIALRLGNIELKGRVLAAPMTGGTDLPFRRLSARLGAAYVATEMVACAEFARGRPDQVRRAAVGEGLDLMVVQLVGGEPDWITRGAQMAVAAGAQIIEVVNMEEIAAEKQYEFAFLGFPLKLRGATGAPMPIYVVPMKR